MSPRTDHLLGPCRIVILPDNRLPDNNRIKKPDIRYPDSIVFSSTFFFSVLKTVFTDFILQYLGYVHFKCSDWSTKGLHLPHTKVSHSKSSAFEVLTVGFRVLKNDSKVWKDQISDVDHWVLIFSTTSNQSAAPHSLSSRTCFRPTADFGAWNCWLF